MATNNISSRWRKKKLDSVTKQEQRQTLDIWPVQASYIPWAQVSLQCTRSLQRFPYSVTGAQGILTCGKNERFSNILSMT